MKSSKGRALMKELTQQEKKLLFNYLGDQLLNVFQTGEYTTESDLQADFAAFKSDLKQYHNVIDRVLQKNPLGRQLTWRKVKITAKRWRICKVCCKPFIAFDRFNKMKICVSNDYVRYNVDTGRYFKSTGKSQCFMLYRRLISRKLSPHPC